MGVISAVYGVSASGSKHAQIAHCTDGCQTKLTQFTVNLTHTHTHARFIMWKVTVSQRCN